jgi:putative transposase
LNIRELTVERPRFGYRGIYRLLRRRGFRVNHKRV